MRNLKKFLALVLAMMMVMGLMVTANASSIGDFSDADELDPRFKQAAEIITTLGVMDGYGDAANTFGFGDKLARAHLAAVMYRIYTGNVTAEQRANDFEYQFALVADGFEDPELQPGGSCEWAVGYINYAVAKGWLNGYNGKVFGPNDNLTVVQMLTGILKVLDLYPANVTNWTRDTVQAAQAAGLIDGFTYDEVLGDATRAMVTQMAFEGLIYAPEGEKTVYKVGNKEFDDIGEALVYSKEVKDAIDSASPSDLVIDPSAYNVRTVTERPGSLAEKFGLKQDSVTDENGRTTVGWVIDGEVIAADEKNSDNDPIIFNTKMASGAAVKELKALGITKINDEAKYYTNGEAHGLTSLDILDTLTSKNNATVEVYVNSDNKVTKVIHIETLVKVLTADDITEADEDTGEEAYITLEGEEWPGEYEVGDVIVYTKGKMSGDTVIVTAEKAAYTTGTLTAKDSATRPTYVYISGTKYNVSDAVGNVADGKVPNKDTTFAFYLDDYNNVVYIGNVPTTETEDGTPAYLYVLDFQSSSTTNSMLAENVEAKAEVLDPLTGEVDIIPIAVVKSGTKWYYADKDGKASSEVKGTAEDVDVYKHSFVSYVETDLGYVLTVATSAMSTTPAQFAIKKGDSAITLVTNTKKIADSKTTLVVVTTEEDDDKNDVYTSKTYTGYKNFPEIEAGEASAAMVVTNADGIATVVYVILAKDESPDTVKYALHVGPGDITVDGQTQAFFVDGEKVSYPEASGSDIDATAGKIYTLTVNDDGELTAATEVTSGQITVSSVDRVGDGYIATSDNTTYNLADNCVVYDVTDTTNIKIGTVKKGDSVDLYRADSSKNYNASSNLITVIVIKSHSPS